MSGTTADGVRDVVIIGSGPAGYTAALYTARAELKPLVFGGAIFVGGALTTTTGVENFPGFPEGIDGPVLMENMRAQAMRFGAEMVDDDIVAVDLTGDIKTVTDTAGTVHRAKAVIVATGSGYRKLGLPKEDEPPAGACPGARPATAFSSATATSSWSAAATPPWRRPPSSPASPAP